MLFHVVNDWQRRIFEAGTYLCDKEILKLQVTRFTVRVYVFSPYLRLFHPGHLKPAAQLEIKQKVLIVPKV